MFYALLASLAINGLTCLYLLWRKSRVEGELKDTQGKLTAKSSECEGWKASYAQANTQIAQDTQQIKTLESQNATLLQELQKIGAPGVFAELLQKRNDASIPSSPKQ